MILFVPRWTFPTSMFEYSPHQHHLCYTLWEKVWLWRPNVCHSAKTHRWSYAPSWLSILACKSPSVLRSSSISLELVAQGHLLMLDCFEEALGYWNIAFFVQGFSAFVKSHSVCPAEEVQHHMVTLGWNPEVILSEERMRSLLQLESAITEVFSHTPTIFGLNKAQVEETGGNQVPLGGHGQKFFL